jgi:hypothetical protein
MSLHTKLNVLLISVLVLAVTVFCAKLMWPEPPKPIVEPPAQSYPPDPNGAAIAEPPPPDQLFDHHQQPND